MSNEIRLGQIISTAGAVKDAIHVAIAPVICDEKLRPGQHVALVEGTLDRVCSRGKKIGIIDPFLKEKVIAKDIPVYILLYPNTVTGMRHEWEHPAFVKTNEKEVPLGVDLKPSPEEALKMVAERALNRSYWGFGFFDNKSRG